MREEQDRQFEELMRQAWQTPRGPARIMLLEEAARLADSHGRVDQGFAAREELIETGTFSGYPEKSLVAFSWCLAQYDRDPQHYSEHDLLWRYKWIGAALARFPQITRQQINDMLADMGRRYQQAGAGLRSVYKLHWRLAMEMGNREEASHYHRLWEQSPNDWLTDCRACECNDLAEYQIFTGQDDQALTTVAPILRGSLRCAEIPHLTLGLVLQPLFRLGRLAEAMQHHHKGYRLTSDNREFLPQMADHLTFLVLTDNLAKGVKLLEKHLPWALEATALTRRFDFYLAARFLLERLQESGKESIKLRLPQTFPGYQESGKYDVAALAAWFDEQLKELAGRFDARNGNEWFSERIAARRGLKRAVAPFPLRPPRVESEKGADE